MDYMLKYRFFHLKSITIFVFLIMMLCSKSYAQNKTETRIKLFKQTTGIDSIFGRNDTVFFSNPDSTHFTYYPDLTDTANDLIDSLIYTEDDSVIFFVSSSVCKFVVIVVILVVFQS